MCFNEVKSTIFNRNSRDKFKSFLSPHNRFFVLKIFSFVEEIQSLAQNNKEVFEHHLHFITYVERAKSGTCGH
jgi:hypothetical protein